MDDISLIRLLKQGNQLAFSIIYQTYARQTFSLSFKYLCNKELAEDAVQNLFLKLWSKRAELDEHRPLNRYLFTILKHDLLNTLRDSKSDIFVLDDCIEIIHHIRQQEKTVEDSMMDQEQIQLIRTAIDQLSPQRKKIFSMKLSGKYSNQEIADILNLSVNTIKFQYSQSLKQIKEVVRKCAISILI